MKNKIRNSIVIIAMIFSGIAQAQMDSAVFDSPGTFTWTVPIGVTSVTVQCWGGGGGGAGGYGGTNAFAGGGGGGGFVLGTFTVVALSSYSLTVGTGGTGGTGEQISSSSLQSGKGGGTSFFINSAMLEATGGSGAYYQSTSPNLGGDGFGSNKSLSFFGGSGAADNYLNPAGGGGGGCGGRIAPGGNGNVPYGGIGGGDSAGNGGRGRGRDTTGDGGFKYGGGGGGGGGEKFYMGGSGGNGGNGRVIIKWDITTSISKVKSPLEKIYPSPFTTNFTVVLNQPATVTIYDILGHQVYRQVLPTGNDLVSLESVPTGIYFINVDGICKKIVKE